MYTDDTHALDLSRVLDALLIEQHLDASDTLRVLEQAHRHPDQHPLETIASLDLHDRRHPDRRLDLDILCQWLANRAGQPFMRIDPLQVDLQQVSGLMSPAFAQRHGILAVAVDDSCVTVASAQPYQCEWEADLVRSLGKPIRRVLASPVQVRQLAQTFVRLAHSVKGAQRQQTTGLGELEHLLELGQRHTEASADDAHIVHIVDWLLQYAIEQRASDIHLEPRREQGQLRYRIDGLLHTVYAFRQVSPWRWSAASSTWGAWMSQKAPPQDGRLKSRLPGVATWNCGCPHYPRLSAKNWYCGCSTPNNRTVTFTTWAWRATCYANGKGC